MQRILGRDFRIGIGHGENDRLVGHRFDHGLSSGIGRRQAEKHICPFIASASVRLSVNGMGRFPLVHAFGAALIDHALGVAEDDILGPARPLP
jgi:hypothetical protein